MKLEKNINYNAVSVNNNWFAGRRQYGNSTCNDNVRTGQALTIMLLFLSTIVPVRASSTVNLGAAVLEVIQAAQDKVNVGYGNSGAYVGMPLVARKLTVVRIIPGVTGTAVAINGVTAQLRGYQNGAELPDSPLMPSQPSVTVNPADDALSRRRDAKKTFNFLLPKSWTAAGTITLEGTINPGGAIEELPGGAQDNTVTVTGVTFTTIPSLMIRAVPITLNGTGPLSDADVIGTFNYMTQAYPVSSISIKKENTLDVVLGEHSGCNYVLANVQRSFKVADPTKNDFVYGVMPYGLDCSGLGQMPGRFAIGHGVLPNRGWIAAQEIAHNLGLTHAGNDHGEALGGGYEPWPYYHGGFGVVFEGRGPEGAAFVPSRMLALPATGSYDYLTTCTLGGDELCRGDGTSWANGPTDHAHDFMSYGGAPVWVSPLTYQRLFDKLQGLTSNTLLPPGAPRDYLVISGRLRTDGGMDVDPFYRIQQPTGTDDAAGSGPFAIELQSATGQALFARNFSMPAVMDGNSADGQYFVQMVPYDSRTARIVIKQQQATLSGTLASVTVTPRAPSVTITAPRAGEVWDSIGQRTVSWMGSDPDGGPLHYAVHYSADKGATWAPLAMDVTSTSLTVNTAGLAGSRGALIRVLATDGVNTTEARSNGTFIVASKPPAVAIQAPHGGSVFQPGVIISLVGDAMDPQGSEFPESAFSWYSDRAGLLGQGRKVTARWLAAGTHRLTLKVTGTDGQNGTDSVTIDVSGPPSIVTQPLSAQACVSTPVTFSVTATGTGLSYQWRKNGSPIAGATGSTLTIASVASGDAGSYRVDVSNQAGAATSAEAILTVNTQVAIISQPASATKAVGQAVTFSVTATGSGVRYQWRGKDGGNISGATGSTYAIPSVSAADAGTYSVVVFNGCGTVNSTVATLTVTGANDARYVTQQFVPSSMTAGKSYNVSVTMKNAGLATWTGPSGYKLISQQPVGNTTWGISSVGLPAASVAPGNQAAFTFAVTAPTVPGNYHFQWRMAQNAVGFGDSSADILVTVAPASGTNDSRFVIQSVPTTLVKGQQYNISIKMRNAGTTTWTAAEGYKLVSQNPIDNLTWGISRADLPASVPPGSEVTFAFTITAPPTGGTYRFGWRVSQNLAGFGDFSPDIQFTIAP